MFTTLYKSLLDWNEVSTTLIWSCIIILLCIEYKRQNDHKSASFIKKLQQNNKEPMPSPPTMPIIGHIHLLRDYQHNPWDGFEEIRKKFGNVVNLKMGIHQMVLVSSDKAMREILLEKGTIFSDRPNFARHHIIFGGDKENSLALCNWSKTHRDRRRMCKLGIVPTRLSARNALLENIISEFVVNFMDNINSEQVDKLSSSSNSIHYPQIIKMTKENILFLTSDIFMNFLCTERHEQTNSIYREFVLGCDFVFWDINQMYLIDFLPFLTSLGLGYTYLKKLKRITDFLRDYIDDKIFVPRLEKLSALDSNSIDDDDDENNTNSRDYLDSMIIEHLIGKTSMSLADYKVGFADLLAGHAAVANILMRVLGHLALEPELQDMISKEVREAGNLNPMPSLPITEATMQEALRLASSPIVPHVATENTSIDKYYVPKGTMVLFNNYHINLSNVLYENPKNFNPLRFLETDPKTNQYKLNLPKHFIPFSVGLRQCLGYKMVVTTTILFVANLCKRFKFKANNEDLVRQLLSPKGSVALNPDAECFEFELSPR